MKKDALTNLLWKFDKAILVAMGPVTVAGLYVGSRGGEITTFSEITLFVIVLISLFVGLSIMWSIVFVGLQKPLSKFFKKFVK